MLIEKCTPGVMWEFDHTRVLSYEEYKYWTYNALPFGWVIISDPTTERRKEGHAEKEQLEIFRTLSLDACEYDTVTIINSHLELYDKLEKAEVELAELRQFVEKTKFDLLELTSTVEWQRKLLMSL